MIHAKMPGAGIADDAAWRIIAEGAGHVVLLLDTFNTIHFASPNARRLLGHDAAELVGRSLMDLSPRDDLARIVDAHEAVMDGGIALTRRRMLSRQGTEVWVETTCRMTQSGDRRWIVCTVRREPGAPDGATWSRDR